MKLVYEKVFIVSIPLNENISHHIFETYLRTFMQHAWLGWLGGEDVRTLNFNKSKMGIKENFENFKSIKLGKFF